MPISVTPSHTNMASAKVMMMWLVTVKFPSPGSGIMPSRFIASTYMKIVKIMGKYAMPALPAFCRTMFATNS